MENAHVAAAPHAHAHDEAHTFDRKAIWRTFRILLYITVFELLLAIGYYEIEFSNPHLVKHLLNGVFVVLTLAKAFFIIAEFMQYIGQDQKAAGKANCKSKEIDKAKHLVLLEKPGCDQ